jgi:signal transduction histidine kinase
VRTKLTHELPLISGDRVQLQQVILNLLVNAIEAIGEVHEARGEILVSSDKVRDDSGGSKDQKAGVREPKAESSQVLIGVRDSGPGLDPAALEHLFDAFFTTKPQGLGIGLAISRSIVEAHGGRLWATANAPQGAVIQFALPLACSS